MLHRGAPFLRLASTDRLCRSVQRTIGSAASTRQTDVVMRQCRTCSRLLSLLDSVQSSCQDSVLVRSTRSIATTSASYRERETRRVVQPIQYRTADVKRGLAKKDSMSHYYQAYIDSRRAEARRTICVVQCRSLLPVIEQTIKRRVDTPFQVSYAKDYALVEFDSEETCDNFMNDYVGHISTGFPIRSRLIQVSTVKGSAYDSAFNQSHEEFALRDHLITAPDLSEQMVRLYQRQRMTDFGVRTRFLFAVMLEEAFVGLMPTLHATPFGSCVNGFGQDSSDCDLSVSFGDENSNKDARPFEYVSTSRRRVRSELQTDVFLNFTHTILRHFMPGVGNVEPILRARVPIVKLQHNLLHIGSDITTNNKAHIMSELLRLCSLLDDRVGALVFAVRWWAREAKLCTRSGAGTDFNNFQILILVIFYLQNTGFLPSLLQLMRSPDTGIMPRGDATHEEKLRCITLNAVDFKTMQQQLRQSHRDVSLARLITGFFRFYRDLDVFVSCLFLDSGKIHQQRRPGQEMFLPNPFEPIANIMSNIKPEVVTRLKTRCSMALDCLHTLGHDRHVVQSRDSWGLLALATWNDQAKSQRRLTPNNKRIDRAIKRQTKVGDVRSGLDSDRRDTDSAFSSSIMELFLEPSKPISAGAASAERRFPLVHEELGTDDFNDDLNLSASTVDSEAFPSVTVEDGVREPLDHHSLQFDDGDDILPEPTTVLRKQETNPDDVYGLELPKKNRKKKYRSDYPGAISDDDSETKAGEVTSDTDVSAVDAESSMDANLEREFTDVEDLTISVSDNVTDDTVKNNENEVNDEVRQIHSS